MLSQARSLNDILSVAIRKRKVQGGASGSDFTLKLREEHNMLGGTKGCCPPRGRRGNKGVGSGGRGGQATFSAEQGLEAKSLAGQGGRTASSAKQGGGVMYSVD